MATRYGKLVLDDSPRTKVFRAIEDLLREDPNLKRVIKTWVTYRGDPKDKNDFAQTAAPALRMRPQPLSEVYWYPGATKGTLCINFELVTQGLVVDDVENLWFALARALVPREQAAVLAVHVKLKAAGAMTGIVFISQPAWDGSADAGSSGSFNPFGQISIEVQTS